MSNNKNTNIGVSLNYSNKKLTEFPKDIYKYKTTLISLDISGNPLLDLEQAINELKEFKSLKRLKINIETGEEAKKLIQAIPFLKVLNDVKIQEEENNSNETINNISVTKNINIKENHKETDTNFENILEKIKEYDNQKKEKYDSIINDYNKLITKNKVKNTLEICSFFNKILINLINEAQEKSYIKSGSLKPLLEAQTENESIRINYESKINLKNNNINNNTSFFSIDSPNEKIKNIKTETTSFSYVNSNKNLTNINKINNTKKIIRNNSTYNKNKNEIRKEYSKNIKKNFSLSKNKYIDKECKSDIESNKSNNTITIKNIENCFSEQKNKIKKEISQQSRNPTSNILNIKKIDQNQRPKKKFKFTHKSHSKKIINKASLLYNQDNTDANSNINTNVNTDTFTQTMNIENNNNANIVNKKKIKNNSKNMSKTMSTNSDNNLTKSNNNNNYLSKYDMLKNCVDNSTINSFLSQIEPKNFVISNIFDNLKEIITIDVNNIRVLNIKNFLEIISQVYKQRNLRLEKKRQGLSYMKGTLEIDLLTYLKSKYGLKKLIIEWILIIFSSIKAYSKINGEICLFGLILRNELDEGSIDIMQKIKETVSNLLNYIYQYNIKLIEKIKNNKEFMKENEWISICEILYSNDINLRQRFIKKINEFIKNMLKNEKILEKMGKKILFSDFLNLLIMFNLRQRKRYLNNLVKFFQKYDKEKYGIINYDDFKLMVKDFGIFDKDIINEKVNILIEKIDKEVTGQITFNDVVECFDNFYLNNITNKTEDKIKLLDKISNLN